MSAASRACKKLSAWYRGVLRRQHRRGKAGRRSQGDPGRVTRVETLEPRLLLSGGWPRWEGDAALMGLESPDARNDRLVFVDGGIPEPEMLAARLSISSGTQTVLLDADQVGKPFQRTNFPIVPLFQKLADKHSQASAGCTQTKPQQGRGFAFAVTGVNLYISFHAGTFLIRSLGLQG